MRRVVSELSSDVLALDTRFLRTVGPLFFRPGFLTLEYLTGRREPYVPPIRVYIFASVIFFGVAALSGDPVVKVRIDRVDPAAEQQATAMVNAAMTYAHFFLVPVFAALVMLFFRRPRKYYVEHLVFAFHYGAFFFLLFTVFGLTARALLGAASSGPQPPLVNALGGLWGVVLFTYLVVALKRVYGRTWPGTALRAAAVAGLYLIAFAIVSIALIAVAYLIYQGSGQIPVLPRMN